MITDARRLDADASVECDVCIVGTGPAGITVALELESTGARVCLLEAGGTKFERASQDLLEGPIENDPDRTLRDTRLAALGGSTGLWAGWCRPLDPIDFEDRKAMRASGWPFEYDDLVPDYRRAHELCGLGEFEYDPAIWEERSGHRRLAVSDPDLTSILFHVSPVRFGARYASRMRASENLSVWLHAVALRFHMAPASDRVASVSVGVLGGRRFEVAAREFVLATGGVENARLLLLSGGSPERGIGNGSGLVGRYYADHAFINSGCFVPREPELPLDFYFPATSRDHPESRVRGAFSLSRSALEREGLLNSAVFFRSAYEAHPVFDTPEVRALLEIWERARGRAVPGRTGAWLRKSARRPAAVATAVWQRLAVPDGPAPRWPLRASLDCEPRRDNAVTLSDRRDAFRRPLPRVRWSPGDLELTSIRRAYEVLDRAVREAGLGALDVPLGDDEGAWREACESGKHHNMGTTRMHVSPRCGVVDADARVHGTANLHVAGSSVFPTFGYANPTLTIVALASRLGRILRVRLAAGD